MSDPSQVKREDFMENKFTTGLLEHETFSQVQRTTSIRWCCSIINTFQSGSQASDADGLGHQQIPGHDDNVCDDLART